MENEKNVVLVKTDAQFNVGLKRAERDISSIASTFMGESLDSEKVKGNYFGIYYVFNSPENAENFKNKISESERYEIIDLEEEPECMCNKMRDEEEYDDEYGDELEDEEEYDDELEDEEEYDDELEDEEEYDDELEDEEEYDDELEDEDYYFEQLDDSNVYDGDEDACVCPECGYLSSHLRGLPCEDKQCPECGAEMFGDDTVGLRYRNVNTTAEIGSPRYSNSYNLEETPYLYGEGSVRNLKGLLNFISEQDQGLIVFDTSEGGGGEENIFEVSFNFSNEEDIDGVLNGLVEEFPEFNFYPYENSISVIKNDTDFTEEELNLISSRMLELGAIDEE